MTSRREDILNRLGRVIGGVVRATLESTGARAIVLLDPESPEGAILQRMLEQAGVPMAEFTDAQATLTAHPANKTALLVGGFIPRVDLLPLGDVYASHIEALAGEWSADDETRAIAHRAGGIRELDRFLGDFIDDRALIAELAEGPAGGTAFRPGAFPAAVCDEILAALGRTRFRRARTGLVPKLGTRTIGVDLFD